MRHIGINRELDFTNNANGWRTHLSNPSNRVTQFGYDRGGRLTSTTNVLSQVVSFQYNAVNQLTNLINGRNYTFLLLEALKCKGLIII